MLDQGSGVLEVEFFLQVLAIDINGLAAEVQPQGDLTQFSRQRLELIQAGQRSFGQTVDVLRSKEWAISDDLFARDVETDSLTLEIVKVYRVDVS